MKYLASSVTAATCVLSAAAQPADLAVDDQQSSIALTVTLDTAVGARTDSDESPISGTISVELDSYTSPTTITVLQYDLAAGALSFFFDYSFFGTITASSDTLTLQTPPGAMPASGPVQPDGSFVIENVPNQTGGIIGVTGTGVVGSAINGTVLDLSKLTQNPVTLSGTVDVDTGVITLAIDLPLASSGTDPDTGTSVTLAGSAEVVALGDVPDRECTADTNHDGAVTPADFSAWIAAFNASAPECDQNDDGVCTPADFSAWIANFNLGCDG